MKLKPIPSNKSGGKRSVGGFTLVETLAALLFMAIVIPVAVQALQVSSQAGQVANRKAAAARIADQILHEQMITSEWRQGNPSGTIREGAYEFRWQMRNELWNKDSMRLVSAVVTYAVQGHDYEVRLTTLADSSQ